MGTRSLPRTHQSGQLLIEPLEDRFLLSAGILSGNSLASVTPGAPVPSQHLSQTQPSSPAQAGTHNLGYTFPLQMGSSSVSGQAASSLASGQPHAGSPSMTPNHGSDRALTLLGTQSGAGKDGDVHVTNGNGGPRMDADDLPPQSLELLTQVFSIPPEITGPQESPSSPGQGPTDRASQGLAAMNPLSTAGLAALTQPAMAYPTAAVLLVPAGDLMPSSAGEESESAGEAPEVFPPLIPPSEVSADEVTPESSSAQPFAGGLPFDGEAIQRQVDLFFEQLGRLSEEWNEPSVGEKLCPWIMAGSLAAYEWVRLRRIRSADPPDAQSRGTPGPAGLLLGE